MKKRREISLTRPEPKINVNRFWMIGLIFLGFLLGDCKIKKFEAKTNTSIREGFACGDIDSLYGDILIVTPIDSNSYLRLNLRGLQITIHSGEFTVNDSINEKSTVFAELLSFTGTKKGEYGYVWDCSDFGTDMTHPDTLSCLKCHIIVRSGPSTIKDNVWIRIYQVEVLDALFMINSKRRQIGRYISRPIYFRKGFPG